MVTTETTRPAGRLRLGALPGRALLGDLRAELADRESATISETLISAPLSFPMIVHKGSTMSYAL